MDNNSISISPASVADSTSVQEQVVKGSLSSSNLNECEGCFFEGDEFDLENYKYDYRTGGTLQCMWARTTNIIAAACLALGWI